MMAVSISKAWDETSQFVRRERKLILPIVLALLVVPAVLVALVQPSAPAGQQPPAGPWLFLAFASLFLSLVGQLTVMRLALGWAAKVSDALRIALVRVWTVLAAFLILALIVSVVATPVLLLAGVGGGGATTESSQLAVSTLVVALLLVIARFVPMSSIALLEPIGPWPLLKRCWELTRGSYWRLLGFFLTFLVGSLILGWVVESVAGVTFALLLGPSEPFTVSRLLSALAAGLVQGAVQTVYSVMVARIAAQVVPAPSRGT
jgi:hypothetical protein